MSDVFKIGKGDTGRALRFQAFTEDDTRKEVPLPGLLGASCTFSMRNRATGELVIDKADAVLESVVDAILRYEDWTVEQTATVGVYDADFEVTLDGGGIITVPDDGITVIVFEDAD